MTTIWHDRAIAIVQKLHVVDGMPSSCMCVTFRTYCRGELQCHHAACVIVAIVAKQLGRRVAVCLDDITQRRAVTKEFIHRSANLIVRIVVRFKL